MHLRKLLPLLLLVFLFSCNKEKPESGKALVTIEGLNLQAPSSAGARILAGGEWNHLFPTSYTLVFISQETGESYSVQITTDFKNSPPSFELPLGNYSYESATNTSLISSTLPVQFGGNLNVTSSQVRTKLSGVTDFQLLSFQKTNIGSIPKIVFPASGNMSSNADYYFIYAKSKVPVIVDISLIDGRSFRFGWDSQPFSHQSFYFRRETGDPSPSLISEPYFDYLNQVISLKNNLYPEFLFPFRKKEISEKLKETSGLQWIGNRLFTINDSGNAAEIYEIQPETGELLRTIQVSNSSNIDWEDLAASSSHLFIGDFGNNSGNRKDLKVLRIPLQDVLNQNQVNAETIAFIYQDENGTGNPNLPFDCESMVFWNGKLHLFTKGTDSNESRAFVLDPIPGPQVAQKGQVFTAPGKLTGADLTPDGKNLVFIGYETAGFNSKAFILTFTDVSSSSNYASIPSFTFWLGSVSVTSQTEGIAIQSSEKIKISGEQIAVGGLIIPPRLMEIDLKGIVKD
jgi:hypothetical protein